MHSDADAGLPFVARGRRGRAAARQQPGRDLPARRPGPRGRAADRRRRDPPRLRLPLRERRVRPGGDRRRAHLGRPGPGVDRADGLEGRGQEADGRGRACRCSTNLVAGVGDRDGPAAAGEGVRRRRRPRDARRAHAGRAARTRSSSRPSRGGVGVRRRDRLRGAVRRARPARRGAGRSATPHGDVARARRAGLLAPAPAPEGGRGGAGARTSPTRCVKAMHEAARKAAEAIAYVGAGTVEFLLRRRARARSSSWR